MVRRAMRVVGVLLLVALALAAALAAYLWWRIGASRPILDGQRAGAVGAPVDVTRDALGVPTIRAATRADAAWALGYLHGQERRFQMETLRRAAAGELGWLTGATGVKLDRLTRPHRFRARARIIVAGMAPGERAVLDAYVRGVNRGVADLGAMPFEFAVLRRPVTPWTAEDTVLTALAMYLQLQPAVPQLELDRARARARGGPTLADALYPRGGPFDAPLDGSAVPDIDLPRVAGGTPTAAVPTARVREANVPGSNNWAVAGRLSTSGAALVANDMHLSLGVPSIWYRARMEVAGRPALTGVTLPGTPLLVAGSNGRIAWGFTNAYIDTSDAVALRTDANDPDTYATPAGPRRIVRVDDRICERDDCRPFPIEETIWGPVVARGAAGERIAMAWTAHARDAIRLGPLLALEQAGSVAEAVRIAHTARLSQQNLVVGDAAGNVAWTVIGPVPARFGYDGRDVVDWSDGTKGWRGYVAPDRVPVFTPADGRVWTANARVLGGAAYALLGELGYAGGERAMRIRDRLRAGERFAPRDFLAIQLDDVNLKFPWWRETLLRELQRRRGDPALAAMIAPVRDGTPRALPGAVGYRLVGAFRDTAVERLYAAYLGKPPEGDRRKTWAPYQAEGPVRRALAARAATLPGYRDWNAFIDACLADVAKQVSAAGGVARFAWGAPGADVGWAGIRHPLARAIPPLGWITDPSDVAVPGDRGTVRAAAPGFGASERFAVSPGHEAEGLFHMSGGQSGNPRAPYYLAGHDAWTQGRATPFLPGPPVWRLRFVPG